MTGTQYFSVEVTDDSGNELEDLDITFELLDNDGKVVDEDTAVTNNDGVAKGSLKFDEVGGDFDNPTKKSLIEVVNQLKDYSKLFRDQRIIEKHAREIMNLIEKLD